MACISVHSGTHQPTPSARERAHAALARRAAASGIVLLKNTGVLPLEPACSVALFGTGASRTVKGGIGSGDVNNRANVSIFQGLQAAGLTITSTSWIADYEARYKAARAAWKAQVLEAAKQVEIHLTPTLPIPLFSPRAVPSCPRTWKAPRWWSMSSAGFRGKGRTAGWKRGLLP